MKNVLALLCIILTFSANSFSQAPKVDLPIIITDGAGGTQTLRFGLDPLATDGIDVSLGEAPLPPLPPGGVFDARLNLPNGTESSLKDYRNGTLPYSGQKIHEIQYQVGTGTTINISWSFPTDTSVKGRLQDVILGTIIDVTMVGNGNYTITNPGIFNKLKMTITYTNFVLPVQARLKALIEGFYNGSRLVHDTVTVELHNTSSPYALVDKNKVVLDDSGDGTVNFYSVPTVEVTSYYVAVKHRNSIETWSASGQTFSGGLLSYDFTTGQNKAYGNNMKLKGTKWCLYSGDVNQDGLVDLTDISLTDTDNLNFVTGYAVTDVNGDNIVDLSDLSIVDTNNLNFVAKVVPTSISTQN